MVAEVAVHCDHSGWAGYASCFLPVQFDTPYVQDETTFGSLPVLRRQLLNLTPPALAQEAHKEFVEASALAIKERLPLIVDW